MSTNCFSFFFREQEPILLKKPVSVSQSFTKEWRNPLLLSLITSGEKKKKTKLLKKRTSSQKSIKQNTSTSTSTQSLTAAVNFISGSTVSKTLPLLYNSHQEKLTGQISNKLNNSGSKKTLSTEEPSTMRPLATEHSNSKIPHHEVKVNLLFNRPLIPLMKIYLIIITIITNNFLIFYH